ncbi:MAG: hypothetical protein ACREJC_20255, partial [Tepidisphaeraceae bacterium]
MSVSGWTRVDRRLGVCSALCVPLLGIVYIACGAVGILSRGDVSLSALLPGEPYLTICRVIMLALIAVLVVLFCAVHVYAGVVRKTCSLAALVFVVIFAAISGVNTFLLLTVARQA